jgi:hypothetical protein
MTDQTEDMSQQCFFTAESNDSPILSFGDDFPKDNFQSSQFPVEESPSYSSDQDIANVSSSFKKCLATVAEINTCLTFDLPTILSLSILPNQLLDELEERDYNEISILPNQLLDGLEERDDTETRGPDDADFEAMMEIFESASWPSPSFEEREPAETETGVTRPSNVDKIFRFRGSEKLPHAPYQTGAPRDIPLVSPNPQSEIRTYKPPPMPELEREGPVEFDFSDFPAESVIPFDFADFPDDLLLREVATFTDEEFIACRTRPNNTTKRRQQQRPAAVDLTLYSNDEVVDRNPFYVPQENISVAMNPRFDQNSVVQTMFGPAILLPTGQHNFQPAVSSSSLSRLTPRTAPRSNNATRNSSNFRKFSEKEDVILRHAISREGGQPPFNWKRIAARYFSNTRSGLECNSRWITVSLSVSRQQHTPKMVSYFIVLVLFPSHPHHLSLFPFVVVALLLQSGQGAKTIMQSRTMRNQAAKGFRMEARKQSVQYDGNLLAQEGSPSDGAVVDFE